MSDFETKEQIYSLLQDDEDNSSDNGFLRFRTTPPKLVRWVVLLSSTFVVSIAIAGTAGFFVGKAVIKDQYKSNIELGTIYKTFLHNETFSEGPSERSALAWNEMFPQRGGYFSHPTIAPERSTMSVFHQLHCVDMLRLGFYQFYDAARAGVQIKEDDPEMKYSPAHMRHCIDLLRQSLMCHADTTVEIKEGPRGAKGFGTTHKCRDWDQLVSWTTQWQLEDTIPPKDVLGA